MNQPDKPSEIDRRRFFSTFGVGAATGAALAGWPLLSLAENLTPEQRAQQLAELMDERRLFDRGERRVYRGEHLGAISMPLGGIAAGPIQINGQARRHVWQIFKNYQGLTVPNSFFAVRAEADGAAPVVRALQTAGEGPFAPMKALSFSGEYPFGWFAFEEPELPVRVRMEVFSPLIPLNTRDSSIPCAIFNLTAENTGRAPVAVSFLATQRNPIGYRKASSPPGHFEAAFGGNVNRVWRDTSGVGVHLHTTRAKDDPAYGDLALATPERGAKATARWESLEALAAAFARDCTPAEAEQAGPTAAGETADAAIAVPLVLAPGQKRTVTFVLAWHFPNTSFHAKKRRVGNMYANWWPDALAVARDVVARLESLTAQTRLFHETFYRTNLPYWLLDRLISQVAILSSMTCQWAKDGFFFAWEGCNPDGGCCRGNATHVWGYPQAHARLFPEVARRMREVQLAHMKADGMIPVRFHSKFAFPAFDGMCHEITATLREHQTSADPSWLAARWPGAKKAMDYIIQRWDQDANGMLSGPQHAMDGDHGGTMSWLGGTYLCALAAAAKMARLRSDPASAARYEKILKAGQANQDKALFNGEWFIQLPDATPRQDYLTGCYTDQMLGQWWALQVGLGWFYPQEHVRAAMASLFRYNFRTDFRGFKQGPRIFCADDDAGMLQCTWPRGGAPKPPNRIQYAEEVFSGMEYPVACLAIQCGLLREGFAILRAVADRYDGRLRRLPAEKNYSHWGYTGNPFGDDECGKFYARAMSVWSVLLACQGFAYDAATSFIGFAPLWKPEDHDSFFTGAEGWGTYSQKADGPVQTSEISLKWGRLRLKTVALRGTAAAAKLNGRAAPCRFAAEGDRLLVTLDEEAVLAAGDCLRIETALVPDKPSEDTG